MITKTTDLEEKKKVFASLILYLHSFTLGKLTFTQMKTAKIGASLCLHKLAQVFAVCSVFSRRFPCCLCQTVMWSCRLARIFAVGTERNVLVFPKTISDNLAVCFLDVLNSGVRIGLSLHKCADLLDSAVCFIIPRIFRFLCYTLWICRLEDNMLVFSFSEKHLDNLAICFLLVSEVGFCMCKCTDLTCSLLFALSFLKDQNLNILGQSLWSCRLKKATDLDLHCLQRQGMSGISRTRIEICTSLFDCSLVCV